MFRIETTDTDQLKRIAAAGGGGIVLGLFLVTFNLILPLAAGEGFGAGSVVFGVFGLLTVVLATHPTYQAAQKLDDG
jgi:Na+/melibiose symporter-like transporter